jgi:hypothetical protein
MFAAVAYGSYGQGTVNFSAGSSVGTRISTNSVFGGPATGLTGLTSQGYFYYYALFVADSTITTVGNSLDPTLTAGWSQATWAAGNPAGVTGGIYGTNAAVGRFTGNPTTDDVLISGRGTGISASFIVVGWSSQVAGQDWNTAKAWIDFAIVNGEGPTDGWVGASAVATSVQLGGGVTPVGGIFGGNAGEVLGFVLQPQVPEPGTFALVGLGAATLSIFRRRKN